METVYRVAFWTLIFCHHTRSLEEECNNPLGMQSKSIPDESITSSSKLDSYHEAYYGRLGGENAWCSTIEDENPYIEIALDEEKAITGIVTQGSSSDLIWSKKYEIEYLEGGKWTSYKQEHTGNSNCCRRRRHSLHPAIRTRSIRIYPKHPFGLMRQGRPSPACLRLELYGCSATAPCNDPGIPENGNRNKNDSFMDGDSVEFYCNSSYSLFGPPTIRCLGGKWSSALPQCREDCADPGAPPNGLRGGNDFQHGKTVIFVCQPDFKLSGVNSITCNDGIWSDTIPVCTALCKDPGIPQHGARKGDNFEDNKTVNLTCNNGYTLVGSSMIECRGGIWSSALPQCKENCANPGAPPNGLRRGNDFQHGRRVIFVCQPDFKLSGATSITCIDGTWSDTIPVCTALCKDPGIPQHGARKGDNFEDGKTVKFTCNNGYSLIGSSTIECRGGIWSSALPQCKRPCVNPGTPQNGVKVGSDFRHGRKVRFVCHLGFKLIGISSITCQHGRWSDQVPVCKAICKIPTLMNNGVILRGNFDNEGTIEFSCNRGYKLIGSRVLRCVNGQWNDRIPECRKAVCPSPPRLVHGSHDGIDFSIGKNVTYSCNAGYLLEGDPVITCVDGQWVGQVPICRGRTGNQFNVGTPLCTSNRRPHCHPNKWVWSCKVQTSRSVYYVQCELREINLVCRGLPRNFYNSVVCCSIRCP